MHTPSRLILSLFFISFLLQQSFAKHIIGGDMSYDCLGNDSYEITLKLYRDCLGQGADFDSGPSMHVTIYEGSNTTPFQVIGFGSPTIQNIDPLEDNECTEIPPNVCVQSGTYTRNLNLPPSSESYYIVYQRCCRNQSISNIQTPGDSGATFFIEITSLSQTECNDSPVFNNFPPPVICLNQVLNFDHSATDPEGDQLVYSFCSPLLGGGTLGSPNNPGDASSPNGISPNPDTPPPYDEASFIFPNFSPQNPLGSDPPTIINPTTGLITGIPGIDGQFVVGICVEEYRNGILLSRLQRDFQFNVTECDFLINADVVEVDFDPVQNSFNYLSCGENDITLTQRPDPQIDEHYWEIKLSPDSIFTGDAQSIDVAFPGPGQYDATLVLNPGSICNDTFDFQVNIMPPLVAEFDFNFDPCVAGPVDFTDLSALASPLAIDVDSYLWDLGDGQTQSTPEVNHHYENAGVFPVRLTIRDSIGCSATYADTVSWFPAPPVIIIEPSTEKGCNPIEVSYKNISWPVDSTYDIQWDFGAAGKATGLNPFIIYENPGVYDVAVEITSPIGCFTDTVFSQIMKVDTFPAAGFAFAPDMSSTFNNTVQFADSSIRAGAWQWNFFDIEGNSYDEETYVRNPAFTFPDTGLHKVELVVSHYNIWDCLDTAYAWIDIVPELHFQMPNAFTPNGDGKNDVFHPVGYLVGLRQFSMRIQNRWGKLVFQSNNPDDGWNGMLDNGKLAPPGVYVCIIQYTGPRGQRYEYQGFTTLLR